MPKNLLFAFTLLLSIVSLNASANTISGTISLPAGMIAPSGGITFTVSTFPLNFLPNFQTSSDTVTIPTGANSVAYFLQLEDDTTSDERIEFECETNCGSLSITTNGYWSTNEGVVTFFDATEFSSLSNHVVNIVLETADLFTGTISLPEGFTADGDEFFSLRVRNNSFFSTSFSAFYSAELGDTQWDFAIGVPTDQTPTSWTLELSCLNCDEDIPEGDQFATTVNGDPLSLSEEEAFFYAKNNNYSNLNLTLISTREPEPEPTFNSAPIQILLLDDEEE